MLVVPAKKERDIKLLIESLSAQQEQITMKERRLESLFFHRVPCWISSCASIAETFSGAPR